MQYEFKRFGEGADVLSPSIQLILNGENLNEMFTSSDFSFTVTAVAGRGRISHNVDSISVTGSHKEIVKRRTLSPRNIEVVAIVKAISNEVYREKMSELMFKLHNKTVNSLRFTDESSYEYFATFDTLTDEDEKSNRQRIVLSFTCHDPFKYKNSETIQYDNSTVLNIDTHLPVVADEIRITFNNATDAREFTLSNVTTDKKIVYRNDVGTAVTVINQSDMYLGSSVGTNRINGLDLTFSDFVSFRINKGDQLVVQPTPSNIQISYRGVSL